MALNTQAATIGVLDSGLGGLSILAALRERLPGASYIYGADTANFPYGTRADAEVVRCTLALAERLNATQPLDVLVVACNTASTLTLPILRAALPMPIVGVVPAIKPAAAMTHTGTIGLLATPATIGRPYIDDLVAANAATCRVIRWGSAPLVLAAEAKLRGRAVPTELVQAEIAALFHASPPAPSARLDTVVLGCTHFPLLATELAAAAPWPVRWVDSGAAVAARVEQVLGGLGKQASNPQDARSATIMFTKQDDDDLAALAPVLARLDLSVR